MWLFLSDSMLSIVRHKDEPWNLLVRARLRGDIERVFPHVKVTETPTADYRFRATIHETVVGSVIEKLARAIDYQNFKGSVKDQGRHTAYMQVWSTMAGQQEMERDREKVWPVVKATSPAKKAAPKRKAKPARKAKRVKS